MEKGYFLNETFTTTTTTTQSPNSQTFPPYDVVDKQGSSVIDKPDLNPQIARDSCGVQIYSGQNPELIVHLAENNNFSCLLRVLTILFNHTIFFRFL